MSCGSSREPGMWTSFPPGLVTQGVLVAELQEAVVPFPGPQGRSYILVYSRPPRFSGVPGSGRRARSQGAGVGGGGGERSPGHLPRAPCSGVGTEAPRALPAVLREAGEAWGFSEPRLWVRLLVARPRLAQISLQVHTQRGQWLTHTFQLRDFQEAASGWARNLGVGRSAGGLCTPTAEPGFLLCSLY